MQSWGLTLGFGRTWTAWCVQAALCLSPLSLSFQASCPLPAKQILLLPHAGDYVGMALPGMGRPSWLPTPAGPGWALVFPRPTGLQAGPVSGWLSGGAGPAEGPKQGSGCRAGPGRDSRNAAVLPLCLSVRLMRHWLRSLNLAPTPALLPGSGAPHVQFRKRHSRGAWAMEQRRKRRPGPACSRHLAALPLGPRV